MMLLQFWESLTSGEVFSDLMGKHRFSGRSLGRAIAVSIQLHLHQDRFLAALKAEYSEAYAEQLDQFKATKQSN
jgi:hypothetical protein